MAKKRKAKTVTTVAPSEVLRAMVDANRKQYASTRTLVGSEMKDNLIGLPLPSFALMWLIESTILPLGKIIGLAGDSQSQKSSLGFEMMGWLMRMNGIARLLENEGGKWSDSLIRSLVGPYVERNQFAIEECKHIGEVQSMTTSTLQFLKKQGLTTQLTGIMVDSLMGTATEERTVKIVKEGNAGRAFADGALSWTSYLQFLSGALIGWPVLWLFINHLKDKQSTDGRPAGKSTPGGKAQRFYSAVYLWMNRIQSTSGGNRSTWEHDGKLIACPMTLRTISIKCDKNSLGEDGRKINVDFCWWFDRNNVQHSFFNWDGATVQLLLEHQEDRGYIDNEVGFGRLDEVCKITCGRGDAGNTFGCPQLGVTGVMSHTLGNAIHNDPEMMKKLISFFHIHERPVWQGQMLEEPSELVEPSVPLSEGTFDGDEDADFDE
jgi:hypothetical protein